LSIQCSEVPVIIDNGFLVQFTLYHREPSGLRTFGWNCLKVLLKNLQALRYKYVCKTVQLVSVVL